MDYYTIDMNNFIYFNDEWNGLSRVYLDYEPIRVDSYDILESFDGASTLFIIGPDKSYTSRDAEYLRDYLSSGGQIVLADDFGLSDVFDGSVFFETALLGLDLLA